jgi:phosphatidylserine decarboxylase
VEPPKQIEKSWNRQDMNTAFRHEVEDKRRFPIASEGFPYMAGSTFVTVYFAALGLGYGALFFFVVTLFVVWFFRDPERVIPNEEGAIICPADGKVIGVDTLTDAFGLTSALKVSIFMNVFNVHVNRIPLNGTVKSVSYRPGKFFSANLDKASKDNERNAVFLDIGQERQLVVVQIAGLIARRIVCKIRQGDHVRRGQRFGIICFGSRVDCYLPSDAKPAVGVGDKVLAGASILGHLP